MLNDRREKSWHVARLDYWRWHFMKNCQSCDPLEKVTFILETASGKIAAVLHPATSGEAFLQTHPDFRPTELEYDLLTFAEQHLAVTNADGQRHLFVLADQDDSLRQQVLTQLGYAKHGQSIHKWRRDLADPIPETPIAPEYTIRSMGDEREFPARSWASWKAFHPDEPDDQYDGWEWYAIIQSAPLYRRDLDIVAAASTGEIAAFCTIWYDDASRSACCVLVGTVPQHQRRGLGKAVMIEGLRRLKRMGGTRVLANGYDPQANALYGSVLGAADLTDSWVKTWSEQ